MSTASATKRVTRMTAVLAAGVCCLIASLGLAQTASADPLLPAPSILSGPLEGQTINTDSASFVFEYLDPIGGGTLIGYLCSVDGAPAVACSSNYDLLGLTAGAHVLGVSASIMPLGGEPLCVLTICLTLPPVAVSTDLITRTFTVDLANGGSGAGASTSANTTHNNSSNVTNSDRVGAFALAWGKYKRQQTKCNTMKKRIKTYKTHKNRMRAAKRHKNCVKTQKKLRAQAMAIAR